MLFPEGIFYDKKKDRVRTSRVNSVFFYFVELARFLKEKKSGRNNLKIVSPALVEVTGIEPVSKHDIQKLSTCLFLYCLSGNNRNRTNQLFP